MSQPYKKRRSILALLVVAATLPLVSSASPAAAATAPSTSCNSLLKLLGLCPKPATTTTAPTTTTTAPATTTTATLPPTTGTACGGRPTIPKTGGGLWKCDFNDEFNYEEPRTLPCQVNWPPVQDVP